MKLQLRDALRDGRSRPGQKARAHTIGDGAETQVETGGLDLAVGERLRRANSTLLGQRRDHAVGQDSMVRRCEGERHAITLWTRFIGDSDLARCPV